METPATAGVFYFRLAKKDNILILHRFDIWYS